MLESLDRCADCAGIVSMFCYVRDREIRIFMKHESTLTWVYGDDWYKYIKDLYLRKTSKLNLLVEDTPGVLDIGHRFASGD